MSTSIAGETTTAEPIDPWNDEQIKRDLVERDLQEAIRQSIAVFGGPKTARILSESTTQILRPSK